ncbi:phage portal protein family protein [Brevinema andersonii]|nr:DUF935 family protein [Brevinema andersonii]
MVPNPNRDFFRKSGVSPYQALKDITFVPEVEAAIIAREAAVIGDEFAIIGDDHKTVDFVQNNILDIHPRKVFRAIYEAVWHGFTVLHHPMIKINRQWLYESVEALPNDWFSFNEERELVPAHNTKEKPFILTLGDIHKEGELIPYRNSFLNPYGDSQLARVFWPATWLRGDMEYWTSYIMRFGDDSILASTDISTPQKRAEMLQAITEFRSSGGIVVDGSDKFEILKTEKTGTSTLFKTFYDVCSEQINKLILGHASALNSTPGKLGNDQGLNMVREDIMADDKKLIQDVMNRLVTHLCLVNGFKEIPTFRWVPEKEDEMAKINRDQKLVAMGFQLSEAYIRHAYGFNEGDITLTDINKVHKGIPSFAEGFQNKKDRLNEEYFGNLDQLFQQRFNGFTRPFQRCFNSLITSFQGVEFWEDALAKAVTIGEKYPFPSEGLALDLLISEAIGRQQIVQRVKSLRKAEFSDFSDKNTVPYFSTFEEAKNWFTKKKVLSNTAYNKLEEELKQYAFTVTGLAKTEQIGKVLDTLVKSYDEGLSYYEFKKQLKGISEEIERITEAQLQLVYRQNMANAFSEGRFKQMMQATDVFPNWEYITIGDGKVRPSHAALDGQIRRYDDPFWNMWYPPNGFNCRCVVEVTDKKATGQGIPEWNPALEAQAAEIGSPMRGQDYGGKILPEKGFQTHPAGLSYWIKDKVLESHLLDLRNSKEEFGFGVPILGGRALTPWDTEKNNISAKPRSLRKNKAMEVLENQLTHHRIMDQYGSPVFINPEYLVEHMEKDWDIRSRALPLLTEILQKPTEIWIQLERQEKNKTVIWKKRYLVNIDRQPWCGLVEYHRETSFLPMLVGLFPIEEVQQLKRLRTGVLGK